MIFTQAFYHVIVENWKNKRKNPWQLLPARDFNVFLTFELRGISQKSIQSVPLGQHPLFWGLV